jgi:hypothetical protein
MQREWLEQQRKGQEVAATWPEHIFENFFVLVRHSSNGSIASPAAVAAAVTTKLCSNTNSSGCAACAAALVPVVQPLPLRSVLIQRRVVAAVAVQGLPPDIELTQVAEQLCGELVCAVRSISCCG